MSFHREAGDREGQAAALNGLGEVACTAGHPTEARAYHSDAHAIAVAIGDRYQQARAHTGLGRTYRILGSDAASREHYRHALHIRTSLDTTEADRIRAHSLTSTDENSK